MHPRGIQEDRGGVPGVVLPDANGKEIAAKRINALRNNTKKQKLKFKKTKTYDLVNAGKEHRFAMASGAIVAQCNFGYLYGMWWVSFIAYAKTTYGVEFTPIEAERIRNDFFRLYSGLDSWHSAMKQFAIENGYVRSYTGRVRHLPMVYSDEDSVHQEALRMAVNSPVQEFASSLGVITLARLDQEIDTQYLTPSGFIHDALYAYVSPEHLVWGAKTLKRYMESTPIKRWFGIDMKVKMVADVAFGYNGRDVYEMENLELDKPFDLSTIDTPFCLPPQEVPPNDGRAELQHYLIDKNIC